MPTPSSPPPQRRPLLYPKRNASPSETRRRKGSGTRRLGSGLRNCCVGKGTLGGVGRTHWRSALLELRRWRKRGVGGRE
eukprot:10569162-Alexandrium_andersonii.AAC.1